MAYLDIHFEYTPNIFTAVKTLPTMSLYTKYIYSCKDIARDVFTAVNIFGYTRTHQTNMAAHRNINTSYIRIYTYIYISIYLFIHVLVLLLRRVLKTQPNHWTKRMVRTQLTT